MGKQTGADSVYMDIREVTLSSGFATLTFPLKVHRNRLRRNNEAYCPDVLYNENLGDTEKLQQWVIERAIKLG